jgi:hypothetical protein
MRFKVIIIASVLLFVSGCDMRNRFIYFPGSAAPSEESLKRGNLRLWQASGGDYRGLVAANYTGGEKGTVIVFHGNGGIAADRTYYLNDLGTLGFRVLLAEYPAYGGRSGEVGEKAFVVDAVETVHLAAEMYDGPLYILGESLGCGVAAAVAAKTSVRIEGIILITPWDTLASVAGAKFPLLPVRLLLTDRYDNIGNLRLFKGKIAVVGAERDEIIPVSHARKLYGSLPQTAGRMWLIRGAGHNDWPMYVNRGWWKEIMDYISLKES